MRGGKMKISFFRRAFLLFGGAPLIKTATGVTLLVSLLSNILPSSILLLNNRTEVSYDTSFTEADRTLC
jgi:hypothetical protein